MHATGLRVRGPPRPPTCLCNLTGHACSVSTSRRAWTTTSCWWATAPPPRVTTGAGAGAGPGQRLGQGWPAQPAAQGQADAWHGCSSPGCQGGVLGGQRRTCAAGAAWRPAGHTLQVPRASRPRPPFPPLLCHPGRSRTRGAITGAMEVRLGGGCTLQAVRASGAAPDPPAATAAAPAACLRKQLRKLQPWRPSFPLACRLLQGFCGQQCLRRDHRCCVCCGGRGSWRGVAHRCLEPGVRAASPRGQGGHGRASSCE